MVPQTRPIAAGRTWTQRLAWARDHPAIVALGLGNLVWQTIEHADKIVEIFAKHFR
jgi:hypothetical protein